MDARNISRQTFNRTLSTFECKYSMLIAVINQKIVAAVNDMKFEVRITNDDLHEHSIEDVGYAIEQYYIYRGYYVIVSNGDEKLDIKPYIIIRWDFESLAQPYESD